MQTVNLFENEHLQPTINTDSAQDQNTAYDETRTPRPWFMMVSLSTRPRCFGCGGRMLPKVVVIQANHALCELCSSIDWSDYQPYWTAIESLGLALEITRSRGIVFWTPPATLRDVDGYLRWMELWEISTGRSSLNVIRP